MSTKIVLMFAGESTNDAILGQMTEYGEALSEFGMSIVHIGVDADELQHAFSLIASGKVGFAFTWLGIAQGLAVNRSTDGQSENLWEAFGIPLLKIQGDLPAYYIQRHQDVPMSTVNLYVASEFIHFRQRWLPDCRAMTARIPTFPILMMKRADVSTSTRKNGKLVFLKNGNSPGEMQQLWKTQLPASVAELLMSMGQEIALVGTKSGPFHIGDFVADFLSAQGLEPDSTTYMVRFIAAQMDDYLRRIKSRMIAEALLDFPVIVQGSFWHHLDFTGRRAQLRAGQDYNDTRKIFADQLGIIDMSPNVDSAPHERVQRAAGSWSTVLTNQQTWLTTDFPGFEDLAFEFTSESIKARIDHVLSNPGRYVDLGIAFGERYREIYPREKFANRVVELAELASLQWSVAKPKMQEYFAWPPPKEH